jgi:hypothetical protein
VAVKDNDRFCHGLLCYSQGRNNAAGGESKVAEDKPTPQTPGSVVEMPWVLISNQIQQLSTQMNERFDQCIDEVEIRLSQRIDQVDKRIELIR